MFMKFEAKFMDIVLQPKIDYLIWNNGV
jgi:hypothetical protein